MAKRDWGSDSGARGRNTSDFNVRMLKSSGWMVFRERSVLLVLLAMFVHCSTGRGET